MSASRFDYIPGARPAPSEAAALDVVFVHGLTGDMLGSWTHEGGGFWPAWLAADFPDINVYCAGYASSSFADLVKGAGPGLIEWATILLDRLTSRPSHGRPVVFVGHSLGGLVVKQLLRKSRDASNPRWKSVCRQTAGVVFIATPHQGAQIARAVSQIVLLAASKALRELSHGADALLDLAAWFSNWANDEQIAVASYHEILKYRGALVVDAMTANPNVRGCDPIAVHADHVSITKLADRQTQLYTSVSAFLREVLAAAAGGAAVSVMAESPSPAPPSPALSFAPLSRTNFVRLGRDAHAENGDFTFSLSLTLVSGGPAFTLLGFAADYIAPDGCYCLNLEPEAWVNGVLAPVGPNDLDFLTPVPTAGAAQVRYGRRVRPPLMAQAPADCDYGDVAVRAHIFWGGPTGGPATIERFFRFEPGGELTAIDAPREPPLLSDRALEAMLAGGVISPAEYERAVFLSAADRYRVARFPDYVEQVSPPGQISWTVTPAYRDFLLALKRREEEEEEEEEEN